MKKFFGLIFGFITLMTMNAANAQCDAVTYEIISGTQTGNNNYFGVKVSIQQTYNEDIEVSGFIYEDGNYDENNPFTLTITAGNLSAETSNSFFMTGPASGADASISSVSPCPPTFVELAADYFDKLDDFTTYTDTLLNGFTQEQEYVFFKTVDSVGVSQTATIYNFQSSEVQTAVDKFYETHYIYSSIARLKFGNVSTINSSHVLSLNTMLNNYLISLAMYSGPCKTAYDDCLDIALENYLGDITLCALGGLSLMATPIAPVGLIGGSICMIVKGRAYNRGLKSCNKAYTTCITAI